VLIGCGTIVLFLILRFINQYGDPKPWSEQQRGPVYTFLSFLNLTKYPPSLLFLCMTLGPGILVLAFIENMQNRFSRIMNVYGRVPMFYYILHFFIIHIIVVALFYYMRRPSSEIDGRDSFFFFKPPAVGLPLSGVYAVWIFTVIVLYPLCKKYDRYKSTHQNWWLRYL
jgi:hypothetical protein